MARSAKSKAVKETDGAYFLKLLAYFVLSTVWLKYNGYVVFPLGALVAAVAVHRDRIGMDRKVEFAVILMGAVIGLAGWGLFIPV